MTWVRELSAAAGAEAALPRLPGDRPAGGRRGRPAELLIGSDKAELDAAEPLLLPLAVDPLHFGPARAGTTYTLIIVFMGAVQIASAVDA